MAGNFLRYAKALVRQSPGSWRAPDVWLPLISQVVLTAAAWLGIELAAYPTWAFVPEGPNVFPATPSPDTVAWEVQPLSSVLKSRL